MAQESNHVVSVDHFEGGSNLQRGGDKSIASAQSGQSLANVLRRVRSGRYVAAAGGDTVITFAIAFDDENFSVSVTGDGTSAPILKEAPTAGTGFTITDAGAGPVHWIAIHDGPSS